MGRIGYSMKLAALDFTRLWASTQHHIIIIAGIVLPILLLLGLKRGHVAELREELLRSPTGRQVMFWSGKQGDLMTLNLLEEIESKVSGVELALPEIDRIVDLSAGDNQFGATLFATKPGDPILSQVKSVPSSNSVTNIILSQLVTSKLKVNVGDNIDVTVHRRAGGREDSATIKCQLTGVLEQPTEETAIGYANFELLDQFEQWIRGFKVESLGWPSSGEEVGPRYGEYLVFLEGRSKQLSKDDIQALGYRGFKISQDLSDNERNLGGCLLPEKLDDLSILRILPEVSPDGGRYYVNYSAAELESITQADDVILPWNGILQASGSEKNLVGLSLKRRTWLRNYLQQPGLAFHTSVDTTSFMPTTKQPAFELPLAGEQSVKVLPYSPENDSKQDKEELKEQASDVDLIPPDTYVVPVQFLARLRAYNRGEAIYDSATQGFVPVPEPAVYGKAKLYAKTIDDVPSVVDALVSRKFSVISEGGRISEIHEQDSSLQLLVIVVGLGVFLFGILTVFSVLIDSTDRKRGVIGILRVMGISREGVFLLVLIRAAAIGVLAGVLAGIAGWGIEYALSLELSPDSLFARLKPDINVDIHTTDVLLVMIGAVACAAMGAIFPALKAAKLDPFDAIVEGRFS